MPCQCPPVATATRGEYRRSGYLRQVFLFLAHKVCKCKWRQHLRPLQSVTGSRQVANGPACNCHTRPAHAQSMPGPAEGWPSPNVRPAPNYQRGNDIRRADRRGTNSCATDSRGNNSRGNDELSEGRGARHRRLNPPRSFSKISKKGDKRVAPCPGKWGRGSGAEGQMKHQRGRDQRCASAVSIF